MPIHETTQEITSLFNQEVQVHALFFMFLESTL